MEGVHRLNTKEDYMYIHKILGVSALIHFIYRMILLLTTGTLGFNEPYSILIHPFLSITSLMFKISNIRHKSLNIIYPELRLHSVIFTLRSVICFYLCYFEFNVIYRMITCILVNISADMVSYFLKQGTTIRNIRLYDDISDENDRDLKLSYSASQLGATLFMLGNCDMCFLPIIAIQIAPFTMTLIKKNLMSSKWGHIIYSICLVLNYIPLLFCTKLLFINALLKKLAEILRFKYVMNKYIMWIFIFVLYLYLNTYNIQNYYIINIPMICFAMGKQSYKLITIFK